jgi:hypothetical protein
MHDIDCHEPLVDPYRTVSREGGRSGAAPTSGAMHPNPVAGCHVYLYMTILRWQH